MLAVMTEIERAAMWAVYLVELMVALREFLMAVVMVENLVELMVDMRVLLGADRTAVK